MRTSLDVVGSGNGTVSRADLIAYPPLYVTSPERTAVDLLRFDLSTGLELLCHLLRSGTDYERVLQRARDLRSMPGMARVYALLRALDPDDLPKP